MTASDDAKFERARREAGHIEAFARIVSSRVTERDDPERKRAPDAQGEEGSDSMEAQAESPAPDEI